MGIILTLIIVYIIASHYEQKNKEELEWCYNYRISNIKHPKLTNKIMKKHDMFKGTKEWFQEEITKIKA